MNAPDWFYEADGASVGPITAEELVLLQKSGRIGRKTQVSSKTGTAGSWVAFESIAAKLGNSDVSRPEEKERKSEASAHSQGSSGPADSDSKSERELVIVGDASPSQGSGVKKWFFLVIILAVIGWFAFSKIRDSREAAKKQEITELIKKFSEYVPLIERINRAQGFDARLQDLADLVDKAKKLEDQKKLSQSVQAFQELIARTEDLIKLDQDRIRTSELIAEAKKRQFASLPGEPEPLVSEIAKATQEFRPLADVFEQGKFEEAKQRAVKTGTMFEALRKTHDSYWDFRKTLGKTDLEMLARYGGPSGEKIVNATTNLARLGSNLEEIAINLRALSVGITNAVKLAYIEKDKSLTREFQTALQGTTRKETLLRLKDWVATAPSGSPASKLFDEQAQEFACWLEWAALEREKETNAFRKAQASIEIVRYWRDVAVLLKDYPDQVTTIAGGRNYDQVVEVLNQSATSAMRSSDQVSEIEARLDLVLSLRDILADAPTPPDLSAVLDTCENLFSVLEKSADRFSKGVASYGIAQTAGIAARLGDSRRAQELFSRAQAMNNNISLLVIYSLSRGDIETALKTLSAIQNLDHETGAICYGFITLEAAKRGMTEIVQKTEPLVKAHWDQSDPSARAWDMSSTGWYPLKDLAICKLAIADLYLQETRRSFDRAKLIQSWQVIDKFNLEAAANLLRQKSLPEVQDRLRSIKGRRAVASYRLLAKAKALSPDSSASELARWISENPIAAERSAAMSGIALVYTLK